MIASSLWARILPSFKSARDPAEVRSEDERIRPHPIGAIHFTPPMRRRLNRLRSQPVRVERRGDARLAVIVPYRNRARHLASLVPALRDWLAGQRIAFELFVVEQTDRNPFNKAALLNAAASMIGDGHDYFCLHDVDRLPLAADYRWSSQPLALMSHTTWEDGTTTPYPWCEGVLLIAREQFLAVNGYSNRYWHWGKQGDDFLMRMLLGGLVPCRDSQGRFRGLAHAKSLARTSYDPATVGGVPPRELLRRNQRRISRMRRGLIDPRSEGLNTLRLAERRREAREDWIHLSVAFPPPFTW